MAGGWGVRGRGEAGLLFLFFKVVFPVVHLGRGGAEGEDRGGMEVGDIFFTVLPALF